jgi:pimeloyl-ACP methyl ester carboxylesterase
VCLATSPDPVMGFLHEPEGVAARRTAVLLCPPFGWEEMCSFRARRRWAQELAREGFYAGRFDLPGTGDSGGSPHDPDLLDAWTNAVTGVAGWLREVSGAGRVAVIGIGLGGLVACRALAHGADIDDLILWAVAARGRTALRELRAYAGVVAARYPGDARPESLPPGALEVTGFLISGQTAAAIESVEIPQLALPDPTERRVLLLGRDALGVDRRLREHYEQAGVELTVVDAEDYGALMAHPQEAQAPLETIRRSIEWLKRGDRPPAQTQPRRCASPAVERPRLELTGQDTTITETPLTLEVGGARLHGVICARAGDESASICAVLLNAGALRRIGPNRTWVELARRWAAMGVPSVRIDFAGIGDSDGDERRLVSNAGLYSTEMNEEATAVLGQLADAGLPNRFVVVGLCSGAYWGLHAALTDKSVVGAFLVNLYAFYWSEALVAERDRRETAAVLREGVVKRVLQKGVTADQVKRALRGIRGAVKGGMRGSIEAAQAADVTLALDQLRDQGTHTVLLISEEEPLYEQLRRGGWLDQADRWPNLEVARLPSTDHMSRAIWLQGLVHEHLDGGLRRVLADVQAKR